ncbi:MAG: hypothetical protein MSG78_02210 [Clostridiales bacterium]|nr:hypothetical protein [Clostridiales bacterium]
MNKLKSTLNSEQKDTLKAYLSLVEKCSPIELSGVNNTVGNKNQTLSNQEYDALVYEAKNLIKTLIHNGVSKAEVRNLLFFFKKYAIKSPSYSIAP